MRFIATLIMLATLAFGLPSPAIAASGDFDSAYTFESSFLDLEPGAIGTLSVFFANTGTTSWVKGSSTQVNLAACLDDKRSCNVTPEEAAFASSWLSTTAYATATKPVVTPGDFTAFTYDVKVPSAQAVGTYRFNGDLVVANTLAAVHPEGYFHEVQVTPARANAISVSPAFASANDKMTYTSAAIPGSGQMTVTFTAPALAGQSLRFGASSSTGVSLRSNGSYGFCDTARDGKGDFLTDSSLWFTAVNGVPITATTALAGQVVPADGRITVTVDSTNRRGRGRVVAFEDQNGNGGPDIIGVADPSCFTYSTYDSALDGALAISGRLFWTGPDATFGSQFSGACTIPWRSSATLNMITAGPASAGADSLRYIVDANDVFKILGTPVTLAQWMTSLTVGSGADTVSIVYDPNPAGLSEFNICTNAGSFAPTNLASTVGTFGSGSTATDVRLTFTAPTVNAIVTYPIQRSFLGGSVTADSTNCALGAVAPSATPSTTPADQTFATVGSIDVFAADSGTFYSTGLATGGYCYRVRAFDALTGIASYSNYVPVNITGMPADNAAPTSTNASITGSSGFATTLDTGDKIFFAFDEAVSLASNATIRLTDSDCGTALNTGPVACSGGTTNTVGDIVCGTNASCIRNTTNTTLTITMSAAPTIVAAGATSGLGYPLVVTDTFGITDLAGNAWNVSGSADRLVN